jgi:hypothetical protein
MQHLLMLPSSLMPLCSEPWTQLLLLLLLLLLCCLRLASQTYSAYELRGWLKLQVPGRLLLPLLPSVAAHVQLPEAAWQQPLCCRPCLVLHPGPT